MIAFVLVGVALVYVSLAYVGSRLDIQENSSWTARLASIVWGLSYLGTSPADLLFGVGPGQSYLLLQSPDASNLLPETSGELTVTAVWSVVVLYVQEMGLLGAAILALTLILVLRAIVRSSARLFGLELLVGLASWPALDHELSAHATHLAFPGLTIELGPDLRGPCPR